MVESNHGVTTLKFHLRLTAAVGEPVTVRYSTRDYTATAGEDYRPASGSLTLPRGETSATVEVAVIGDTRVEGSEALLMDFQTDAHVDLETPTACGVILTDDLGPTGGKIALDFQAPEERYQSIFVMNADGSSLTRLTSPAYADRVPVFSNDGRQIVFESRRDGNPEIYVMNADGSEQRRITRNPAIDGYARFSPDSRQIVFFSNRAGDYNVYITDADGSGEPRRLTRHAADDFDPCFSADGKCVYFPSQRDGDLDIYSIRADGTGLRRLTDNNANEHYPSVSPDGRSITFRTNRDGQYEVYTMATDGSDVKRITRTQESERHPAFSPDGKQIIFQQFIDFGRTSLCAADASGGRVRVLREPTAANLNGTWAPGEVTGAGPRFELGLVEELSSLNRRYLAGRAAYLLSIVAGSGLLAGLVVSYRRKPRA